MSVEAPRRPASTAGLDGVTALVIQRSTVDLVARLTADNALGLPRATPTAVAPQAPKPPMEVTAAAPTEAGLFDGIVGTLLGFLFG